MANEKSITLDNLKTFKAKADATYAKKTDITTSCIYVGKASEKSNSATTNGNTYLKLFDNDTKRSQHLINGTGLTTVASDASGTITINSTLPTNLIITDTEQTVTGTKHFNAITANTIGTGSGANNYFQSQKFRGEGDANTYYHAVDFGYAGHDQVDFYEYGGNYNFYINTQANTDSKQLLFGINPSGIKIPPVAGAKVLGTNANGQVESHSLGIADISSLKSALDGKVNSSSLATVAKTGSYNDLSNKPTIPTIPTNLMTTNTEQFITGKKYFETDLNFGKYISPIRKVSDAPAKLNLMSSAQTNAGFFDTVMFAGAGDWLYLGHLKPDFSIRASFRGNGNENDTYSANLEYTHGALNALTDWDYQSGWCVRPTKVSTTTPAIIQIKFTRKLYTDALRLIITGHNLNDTSSGNAYSGFLDDYTIEVCTNYTNDTWTTVVNRTNASDSIGAGLMYSLQTGSYTSCYGIRLKITKCHVTGTGYAFIKISSMQLRDYRPGIKFPDCLGAISQGGGDVWGMLNTNSDLNTHNVLPYANNQSYLGVANKQYYSVYSHNFYENGTALSDKYLAKGYLERLSPKLYRHTIKIEGYNERTTGTPLVCMLQVDSSLSRAVGSFVDLATVLGSIDKETGEPGVQSSCKVSGGIVVGEGNLDYILPLIRLETDGTVNHTVFVSLINEYPDLTEDVDSRFGHLSDYSTVTYTDSVTPVS